MNDIAAEWEGESRELAFACDAAGSITWADGQAEKKLAARTGRPFVELDLNREVSRQERELQRQKEERLAAETEAILSKENLSRALAISRTRDALRKAGVGSTHG